MKRLVVLACAVLALPAAVQALNPGMYGADAEGVKEAVLDYVEGIYDADPARIERSVSQDLVKRGFWRESADSDYRELPMNYEELYELAANWNLEGRVDPSRQRAPDDPDSLDPELRERLRQLGYLE